MDFLFELLIFLGLTGVFALLGLNVWVWPKAAIDRVTASAADPQSQEVSHPSLAFRDLLKKLGTLVPASPKDTTIMQRRLIRAGFRMPNALDLLVVSVESGLGLDQAIVQVAKELETAHPEITEEFSLMNLELKAGKRRIEALRNLADRTNVEDLKKLVAVLIQADRFGTSIAATLRNHAEFMRVQARQVAEEKAAKLGVKLVFPIFFCILPSLFVVTVGPMAFKVVRELLPMVNSM